MPTFPGAAAFDLLRQRDADLLFIFVSGTSGEDATARLDLILQYRVETRRMWISQTAREAGVNTQTLRYYERRGLLPKPPRRGSGYREYPADAVRIVRFIRKAQELGFSLDEIEELVRLRGVRRGERHRVRAIAERKIEDIDRKIAHLQSMRNALDQLVDSCHHGGAAECPIIEALNVPERKT